MLKGIIGDVGLGAGRAIRLGILALAGCAALFATVSFLGAAAFLYVRDRYGPIEACLAVASIFLALTIVIAIVYAVAGRKPAVLQPREDVRSSSPLSAFADPMMLATGLQVLRAIGLKRLLPVLAIAGVAVGALAGKGLLQSGDEEDTESDAHDA